MSVTSHAPATEAASETITLAGGCFWCTEAVFSELVGVRSVLPGYSGGEVANPTYEQVCTGRTGHAEAIQVEFDPNQIPLHDLLAIFFTTHDPTTRNRQGADVGTQYRSAVFYRTPAQKEATDAVIAEISGAKVYRHPLVTEVVPFTAFFPAEEYHRRYYERNPERGYCQMVIAPKVAKFRKQYASRLRSR
jgi:peptide-methionine (S)-S-oxide reductase